MAADLQDGLGSEWQKVTLRSTAPSIFEYYQLGLERKDYQTAWVRGVPDRPGKAECLLLDYRFVEHVDSDREDHHERLSRCIVDVSTAIIEAHLEAHRIAARRSDDSFDDHFETIVETAPYSTQFKRDEVDAGLFDVTTTVRLPRPDDGIAEKVTWHVSQGLSRPGISEVVTDETSIFWGSDRTASDGTVVSEPRYAARDIIAGRLSAEGWARTIEANEEFLAQEEKRILEDELDYENWDLFFGEADETTGEEPPADDSLAARAVQAREASEADAAKAREERRGLAKMLSMIRDAFGPPFASSSEPLNDSITYQERSDVSDDEWAEEDEARAVMEEEWEDAREEAYEDVYGPNEEL